MANGTQKQETYKVLVHLKHSQKHFRKDATIQLTEKEAAPLLRAGAIQAVRAPEEKVKAAEEKK